MKEIMKLETSIILWGVKEELPKFRLKKCYLKQVQIILGIEIIYWIAFSISIHWKFSLFIGSLFDISIWNYMKKTQQLHFNWMNFLFDFFKFSVEYYKWFLLGIIFCLIFGFTSKKFICQFFLCFAPKNASYTHILLFIYIK